MPTLGQNSNLTGEYSKASLKNQLQIQRRRQPWFSLSKTGDDIKLHATKYYHYPVSAMPDYSRTCDVCAGFPQTGRDFVSLLLRTPTFRFRQLLPPAKLCSCECWNKICDRIVCTKACTTHTHTKRTTIFRQFTSLNLSLIHIWRCRRSYACRSRWSPYH